jgi:DNA-binding CsgD family transcriptional regulator
MPFERARTLLVCGIVERRARRRAAARASLEEASGEFERLGARVWAERARAEITRLGGRGETATNGLTVTERRVAELAASGRSNKEIAAALFVTVHTVEVHLSRVYAKVGVRSRAQLSNRLE